MCIAYELGLVLAVGKTGRWDAPKDVAKPPQAEKGRFAAGILGALPLDEFEPKINLSLHRRV